jgi:proteasome lid subunit RPN8/RPN11
MLNLQASTVADILGWASKHPDVEVCGLVWQSDTGQQVWPLPNVHPDPTKYYRTAPRDVRMAFEAMDRAGGQPLAWYHSHPGGKPDPSEEDMQGAMDIAMYYVIAYPYVREVASASAVMGEWKLSVWECLEPCILVGAEWVTT